MVGGDAFAPLALILGPVKKVAMSPSFTVRGGEYDTKKCNIRIESMVQAAFVREIIFARSYQEPASREIGPTFP